MTAKPPREKGHGKRQTKRAGSTREPKNTYRFGFISTVGRASQKRMRCAECSIKWQVVGCARLRARSEDSRHRERLNHHNCARPLMNAEIIRLKFLCWWDAFLLRLFLAIGTRIFGCVAVSAPDRKRVRTIHLAISQRELNISMGRFVERLDGPA